MIRSEQEEPIIKLENILFPEEMKRRFGSADYEIVITKRGKIYISSRYLSEKLTECRVEDESQMIGEFNRAYLSILKEARKIKNNKYRRIIFDKINSAEDMREIIIL